jgi:hypothetical protein
MVAGTAWVASHADTPSRNTHNDLASLHQKGNDEEKLTTESASSWSQRFSAFFARGVRIGS